MKFTTLKQTREAAGTRFGPSVEVLEGHDKRHRHYWELKLGGKVIFQATTLLAVHLWILHKEN